MFVRRFAGPLLLAAALHAQTPSLALSRSAAPDGTAVVELSFSPLSEAPVAALEWTLHVPADIVSTVTVEDGAAQKTVFCHRGAEGYKCIAAGANANPLAGGVVATVTVTLAPGATAPDIRVGDTLGASPEGQPVAVPGENAPGSADVIGRSVPARFRPPAASK